MSSTTEVPIEQTPHCVPPRPRTTLASAVVLDSRATIRLRLNDQSMVWTTGRSPDDRDRDRTRAVHAPRRPHRGRDRGLPGAAARQQGHVRAGAHARGRRDVELAGRRAARRVAQPRRRLEDLRRRRQRVLRLPRWVRRLAGRARPPGHRRGGPRPGRAWHPLRPAHRGLHRGRGQPGRALRAAAVAVRQLRHRVDDGRGPPDARGHRPRPHPQGRGRLPRPPRLGDGLGAPRARRGPRPCRRPDRDHRQRRYPRRDHGPDHRRAVQRPRGRPSARSRRTPARSPA